jgi:hypothetical protein
VDTIVASKAITIKRRKQQNLIYCFESENTGKQLPLNCLSCEGLGNLFLNVEQSVTRENKKNKKKDLAQLARAG